MVIGGRNTIQLSLCTVESQSWPVQSQLVYAVPGMATPARAYQLSCAQLYSSPKVAAKASLGTAAPETLPANDAAVLAEKYAALVQLLRSTSGQQPNHLPQQLQQDLEACLAAWPSQASTPVQQAAAPDICKQEQQQLQQQSPGEAPRRLSTASDTAAATPAAHSAGGGPQSNHSNSSSSCQHDSQRQGKQQEVLDSPESQQTQISGAFQDCNTAATATRMLTAHHQQQHGGAPLWTACSIGADRQHTSPPPPATAPVASHAPQPPPAPTAAACGNSSALPQHYVTAIKSGYRGLTWDRKDQRWRVRVHFMGKQHHVGRFTDEVEVAKHFDSAAYYLSGDKAITNFGIEATKASKGPVPASIRALLQNSTQGSSLVQQRGVSAAPAHGCGFETAMSAPGLAGSADAYPCAAVSGKGAGGLPSAAVAGSTANSIGYQQSELFRQLPVHLAAGDASASGLVSPSSAAAIGAVGPGSAAAARHVSRQRQVAHPWTASKNLMLPRQYHQPQQQQQPGQGASVGQMDSTVAGILDWPNKQVRRMKDVRQPTAEAARVDDATMTAVARAAAATKEQHLLILEHAGQARGMHTLQQQYSACSLFGDAADVSLINIQQQLCFKLPHLQQQLQRQSQEGDPQTSVLSGHALDRKLELMQQLHHNVQELQKVIDDEEQQQQQLDSEQQGRQEQHLGAAAGTAGPTFSAGDVSAFLAMLLALPGLVSSQTPPTPKAEGITLVGQKRSIPEPETVTNLLLARAAAAAVDAAAAGSAVLADPVTQATAEALSALAALITALQHVGDGMVSGGEALAGREWSDQPVPPNCASQEAFAAFSPCKH